MDLYQKQQHLIIILKLHVLSDLYIKHLNFSQSFPKLQQHLLLSFPPNLLIAQQVIWHKVSDAHTIHHYEILHFLLQNKQIFLCFYLGLYNTQSPQISTRISIIFHRKNLYVCTNYQLNCKLLILLKHQNGLLNSLDPDIY